MCDWDIGIYMQAEVDKDVPKVVWQEMVLSLDTPHKIDLCARSGMAKCGPFQPFI